MKNNISKKLSILSWAGTKYQLINSIHSILPKNITQLVETCVGSGSLFFNTNAEQYIWNDLNVDLINLYTMIKEYKKEFIDYSKQFFNDKNNFSKTKFLDFRQKFNEMPKNSIESAALFLYLNKTSFNGICRYNKKGQYNTSYGIYCKKNKEPEYPQYPLMQIEHFLSFSDRVILSCGDFSKIENLINDKAVIYSDPPYFKVNHFYNASKFLLADQIRLIDFLKKQNKNKNAFVLCSNSHNEEILNLYQDFIIDEIQVKRRIASDSQKRNYTNEILAFLPYH